MCEDILYYFKKMNMYLGIEPSLQTRRKRGGGGVKKETSIDLVLTK